MVDLLGGEVTFEVGPKGFVVLDPTEIHTRGYAVAPELRQDRIVSSLCRSLCVQLLSGHDSAAITVAITATEMMHAKSVAASVANTLSNVVNICASIVPIKSA